VVEVAWQGDADAYAVWLSEDGLTWALDDARLVQDSPFRADALPLRPPIYVRVTAVDIGTGGPVHSEATDVYGVTATADGPDVLVVDGNDRWEAAPQPENPRAIGHDFAAVHGAALPGRTFDTADNDAVLAGEVDARDYPIVVWTLGEESDVDRTFDDAEQALVAEFLDGGGALLVSGAELGYDLVEIGTPADAAFFTDVLRAGYLGDDAGTPLAHGVGPFAGGAGVTPRIGFLRPGGLRVSFPDRLEATAGGETWLTYEGGADGAAAVAHASAGGGAGRTVVMGIPLEAIDNDADRTAVMAQVLAFFDG
jgi:hypothetical protein